MQAVSKERKKINELHGRKKMQYIWDYYKALLVVGMIVFYTIGYLIYGYFTHKSNILYTAFVNVVTGDELTGKLSTGFLDAQNIDLAKNTFYMYKDLYLTDDEINPYHEYTYASRMKILSAIDNETLDIVLMNREAFDAFSQNGYLCNMEELLREKDSALFYKAEPFLQENIVILEDNADDLYLDDTASYEAKTGAYVMGIALSATPLFRQSGFQDAVYLGVIANSPRKGMAVAYISYLCGY